MNYSAYQIQDALRNQGIDPDLAEQVGWALGDARLNEEQTQGLYKQLGLRGGRMPEGSEGETSGNFMPNLAENSAIAAIGHKFPKAGLLGMLAGNVANLGYSAASGNNYNERGSWPQLIGDAAGGIAGAAAGGGLGRGLGGAAGSLLGPIGTLVGGTLGGYLGSKLFAPGSKSVEEDDGKDPGGWGTLAGMAALPLGAKYAKKGFRRMLKDDAYNKFASPFHRAMNTDIGKTFSETYNKDRPEEGLLAKGMYKIGAPQRLEDAIAASIRKIRGLDPANEG